MAVRIGGCHMPGKRSRGVTQKQARQALYERVDAFPRCRPDGELGLLTKPYRARRQPDHRFATSHLEPICCSLYEGPITNPTNHIKSAATRGVTPVTVSPNRSDGLSRPSRAVTPRVPAIGFPFLRCTRNIVQSSLGVVLTWGNGGNGRAARNSRSGIAGRVDDAPDQLPHEPQPPEARAPGPLG
ncbi:DUF6233 domain-containing protein [Streptomyces sp. NPDC051214]|uniref:DUF6233 domain-containing protein n=1 Tax=Streptomyces sp. NPDC051214 TaxID=3155282 RepID=UPI003437825C